MSHLHLSYAELRDKLSVRASAKVGDPQAAPRATPSSISTPRLVTPAGIGINLLGETFRVRRIQTERHQQTNDCDCCEIVHTPFLGLNWEHTAIIVPIQLISGKKINYVPKQIKTLPSLHAKKAPNLSERALIFFKDKGDFHPMEPWQLRLLVEEPDAVSPPSFTSLDLNYQIPKNYVIPTAVKQHTADTLPAASVTETTTPDKALAWQTIWSARRVSIAVSA